MKQGQRLSAILTINGKFGPSGTLDPFPSNERSMIEKRRVLKLHKLLVVRLEYNDRRIIGSQCMEFLYTKCLPSLLNMTIFSAGRNKLLYQICRVSKCCTPQFALWHIRLVVADPSGSLPIQCQTAASRLHSTVGILATQAFIS